VTVSPLPADFDGSWTPEFVAGIVHNPAYTGLGPYPAIVTDRQWIQAALTLIQNEGPTQFLVNMLAMLKEAFPEARK